MVPECAPRVRARSIGWVSPESRGLQPRRLRARRPLRRSSRMRLMSGAARCPRSPGPRRGPAALEARLGQERAAALGAELGGRRVERGGRGWSPAASSSRSRAGSEACSLAQVPVVRRPWWPSRRRRCARRIRWPGGGRSRGRCPAACRRRPASISSASSSKVRPRVLPAPAVSSSSSGQSPSRPAPASSALPIRFIDSPCGSPTVEPGAAPRRRRRWRRPSAASGPARRSTSSGSPCPWRRN